jgi:hypothetical protein
MAGQLRQIRFHSISTDVVLLLSGGILDFVRVLGGLTTRSNSDNAPATLAPRPMFLVLCDCAGRLSTCVTSEDVSLEAAFYVGEGYADRLGRRAQVMRTCPARRLPFL